MIDKEITAAQREAARRLGRALKNYSEGIREDLPWEDLLWDTLVQFQGYPFYTAKNLEYFYFIKGNEMFVSRKDKSITKASIMLAFRKALELERIVTGPKKLGTFGASYLYPVFRYLGVIREKNDENRKYPLLK